MSTQHLNILLLEDDTTFCDLFEYIVDAPEVKVHKAHNAYQAKKILKSQVVDFGVFDFHLPDSEDLFSTSPDSFLHKFREENNFSFIFVTGDFSLDNDKAKSFGASQVIYKPFTGEEIMNVIRTLQMQREDLQQKKIS